MIVAEYYLLFIGTVLVNNFVLVKFLGLCPFMGASKKIGMAVGMGMGYNLRSHARCCAFMDRKSPHSCSTGNDLSSRTRLHHCQRSGRTIHRNGYSQNEPSALSPAWYISSPYNHKLCGSRRASSKHKPSARFFACSILWL